MIFNLRHVLPKILWEGVILSRARLVPNEFGLSLVRLYLTARIKISIFLTLSHLTCWTLCS